MADYEPVITERDIKTTLLSQRHDYQVYMSYDDLADTLRLQYIQPDQETVVLTIDDYVGFLYLPASLELVGLYIEDVKYGFLDQYPYLNEAWRRWEVAQKTDDPAPGKTFLFLEFARELIRALQERYSAFAPELIAAFA